MPEEIELIDEIDRDGRTIATHPRSYLKESAFLHKAVLVLPRTADGRILLGRRAKSKSTDPDLWCCLIGGKVKSGESDDAAAAREMQEEVGMSSPLKKVTSFTYEKPDFRCVFSLFTTKTPVLQSDLVLDPQENQYSRAFAVDEALHMAEEKPEEFAAILIVAMKEFAKNIV